MGPPPEVLDAAGLEGATLDAIGRDHRVWKATGSSGDLVLRRCQAASAAWLHPILVRLSSGFPVPEPVGLFDGWSWFTDDAGVWEALSFLPGMTVGFGELPSMHETGAFLASFHDVSVDTPGTVGPRPGGTPLRRLAEAVDWPGAAATMRSDEGVADLRRLVDGFDEQLSDLGYADLPTCVVHGDPTTFNILADGDPPHPSGLIDFELADVEAPVADLAFCLWRSGRRSQQATQLDLGRVRDLLSGYRSVRPLSDQERALLPVLILGRGLQMLVKRTRLAVADDGPVEQLRWIESHQRELRHASA